jgi:hypothetical protein
MTFEIWWQQLTQKEQYTIGINNARFVWNIAQQFQREESARIVENWCSSCDFKGDALAQEIRNSDNQPLFADWLIP